MYFPRLQSYFSCNKFFRFLTCLNFAIKDKEPIKTIDLEECQEVARDDSLGKGNCFR